MSEQPHSRQPDVEQSVCPKCGAERGRRNNDDAGCNRHSPMEPWRVQQVQRPKQRTGRTGHARLTVYLDVKLEDDAAEMTANALSARVQEQLPKSVAALISEPQSWAEITGAEVVSCAISRDF
jgi:hypothetical protein